jgi:hypothetical protein
MRRLEIRMVPIRIHYITGGSIGHPVFLQIASRQRADERTRTAFLLIMSAWFNRQGTAPRRHLSFHYAFDNITLRGPSSVKEARNLSGEKLVDGE